jgi:drug/metabolite transporter (DMT)-like permease
MQRETDGSGSGLLGVIIFSGSLPATRVAVAGFPPLFLTSARAVIAALLGAALLVMVRQAPTRARDLPSLAIVAFGVVIGFPLLTGLALQRITSAQSIVFIGLLPLATALFGVLRGGERPAPAFWLFSLLGEASVAVFASLLGGTASMTGGLLMVAAVLVCGLGYAEGASL